jgi:hypothetical protein
MKLIVEEDRERGAVSVSTYLKYFKLSTPTGIYLSKTIILTKTYLI